MSLLLIVLSALLQLAGTFGVKLFIFERSAIMTGELWRLFSGHLCHLSWTHWFLNSLALVVIVIIFQRVLTPMRLLLGFFLSALTVSLGLLLLQKTVWYVGMSGALHGVLVLAALLDYSRARWVNGVLLTAVAGKLLWEHSIYYANSMAAFIGGPVLVDAHLYGVLGGVISYFTCRGLRTLFKRF